MIDKSGFKLNRVISHGTKYMHLTESIPEAELIFLLASLKGDTFQVCEGFSIIFQVKD
jgi:hypothetical protein